MNEDVRTIALVKIKSITLHSVFLNRYVLADMYLPQQCKTFSNLSLLLINDGQDLPVMSFGNIIETLYENNLVEPLVCVGIHCGTERRMEYGTANKLHFKGYGAKAGAYTKFVMQELLPVIRNECGVENFKDKSFAGFSLGGLSAMDIVLNNPQQFRHVGVFSGSLWWRSRGYGKEYNDNTDRIMHVQVRNSFYYPWLKFFFECGALDELADRNNNGTIDSIDDALDLIKELRKKGYPDENIKYLELADGKHNVATWARAFPAFLQWAYGKE